MLSRDVLGPLSRVRVPVGDFRLDCKQSHQEDFIRLADVVM